MFLSNTNETAKAILRKRYLLKDGLGNVIEKEKDMYKRVANYLGDTFEERDSFYYLMCNKVFMPNTPCLLNAGKNNKHNNFSACFRADQGIIVEDGIKNIRDIKVGDKVLTHNGNFKLVEETFKREYKGELLTINVVGLEKETLKITPEHPVLAILKKEIQCIRNKHANCLFPGKNKKCFKKRGQYKNNCSKIDISINITPKWIPAKDLKKGDFVVCPKIKENIVDKEFIYLSDNNIVFNKNLGCTLLPIQSIVSSTFQGDVYNLEIEEDHSYCANGIAVHNCFVLPIFDSLDDIMDTAKDAVKIHASGGGVGSDFSKLRPKGDIIKSTGGVTPGPLSFIKMYNDITDCISQGGTRRGANMGVLRCDHPDILEFINFKKTNSLKNFNLSVAITNKFMTSLENKQSFSLIHPNTKEIIKECDPKIIWDEIIQGAWQTGDPGVLFIDTINDKNPCNKLGEVIEATNPCLDGDQFILTIDGVKKIKDIVGKETHLMFNGNWFKTTEKGFFYTGKKDVYQLKTHLGFSVFCTLDHPLFVNGIKTKLKNIKIGDIIDLACNNKDRVLSIDYIDKKDVYDVQVPGINKFDLNGIIVSNCGELPLPSYGACVLGHINLNNYFYKSKNVRKEIIKQAVLFLNRMLDKGSYPLEKIKKQVLKTRRIGLGVMGFADLLASLNIAYSSEEAIVFADTLFKEISEFAYEASKNLSYLFGDILDGRANGSVLTIAPTGTVSTICDASPGIEPYFALTYKRTIMDGKVFFEGANGLKNLVEPNEYNNFLQDIYNNGNTLKGLENKYNLKNINGFETSLEIPYDRHILMQATIQKYIDNSISKTINMTEDSSVEDVDEAYRMAYKLGCKGITIYRNNCKKGQVYSL